MSVMTQRLLHEIESAAEPVRAEVLDFILFVKAKGGNAGEPGMARIQRTAGCAGAMLAWARPGRGVDTGGGSPCGVTDAGLL